MYRQIRYLARFLKAWNRDKTKENAAFP
jgi:hypothetical protein